MDDLPWLMDFMDNPISMDELGVAHDFGNLYLTMDHTSPGSMMIYVYLYMYHVSMKSFKRMLINN